MNTVYSLYRPATSEYPNFEYLLAHFAECVG